LLRYGKFDKISSLLDTYSTIKDEIAMSDETGLSAAQDINSRIAQRVRSLRTELGLTLDALATQCEVSRSMISLIERGESSPTAVVLEKIAAGLGVSLASLFEDESTPPNPVSHAADRTTWRDPQTGYLRRNLSPPNYPSPIQLVEVMLPAGATVAYESGARAVTVDQQIWVQEGRIELTVGDITYRLGTDDCLAMELNAPTRFHNPTDSAARYIVVIATERARLGRR